MSSRPIRGIVIREDRQIGATLITGDTSRTPLITIGQYHRGQGAAKVYHDADFRPTKTEGIDFISIRVDRQSDKAIVNADPNSDKVIYAKITNRANNAGGNIFGAHFETDSRGLAILDNIGGYAQVRNRTGTMYGTLTGFKVDVKQDVGGSLGSVPARGNLIQLNLQADAPVGSAGIELKNITDGVYVTPFGITLTNAATSGCKGFKYALNYESDALLGDLDSADGVISRDGYAVLLVKNGAPSDGDYNNKAEAGCLLIDISNKRLYQNKGTRASTNWDYVTNWT